MFMLKKSRVILLATVLFLAFAQVAFPALQAVGPVNPLNGFPLWYRDSTGQMVTLSVPPSPVSLPDPPIPGNAFSQQIGWGAEAFYWNSEASMAVPGGNALLVLALEAAWGSEVPLDGDQVVFARVRIRVDTAVAGTYVVTHPYGTKTYTGVPAGVRAINDTLDFGLAPLNFSALLAGPIGPFLKQVGAPPGTLGDAVTPAQVTGSPTGNNFFQVVGPGVNAQTDIFTTGGELFVGTPFTVTRATFTRDAGGAAAAQLGVTVPTPVTPGTGITGVLRGQPGVPLRRTGNTFFANIPFTAPFDRRAVVRGSVNGANATKQRVILKDVVTIVRADYSTGTQTLTIRANSTDALATLKGTGWAGVPAGGAALRNSRITTFTGVSPAPSSITATSSSGGTATVPVNIVP